MTFFGKKHILVRMVRMRGKVSLNHHIMLSILFQSFDPENQLDFAHNDGKFGPAGNRFWQE
jgi:hypothetical protein